MSSLSSKGGVEVGEGAVPVAALLEATIADPELQEAIRGADANNDGSLSIVEVVSVFTAQRKARADKKRMTRLAAVLGGTLLLMLAANAGLTWAVVALSADTSTSSDGVMTVRGDPGRLVQTATYQTATADPHALLYLDGTNATAVRQLVVPTPQGLRFFQVVSGEVVRGERAVFYDASGANVTISTADLPAAAAAADFAPAPALTPAAAGAPGAGRRLLQLQYGPLGSGLSALDQAALNMTAEQRAPEICNGFTLVQRQTLPPNCLPTATAVLKEEAWKWRAVAKEERAKRLSDRRLRCSCEILVCRPPWLEAAFPKATFSHCRYWTDKGTSAGTSKATIINGVNRCCEVTVDIIRALADMPAVPAPPPDPVVVMEQTAAAVAEAQRQAGCTLRFMFAPAKLRDCLDGKL